MSFMLFPTYPVTNFLPQFYISCVKDHLYRMHWFPASCLDWKTGKGSRLSNMLATIHTHSHVNPSMAVLPILRPVNGVLSSFFA